MTSFEDVEKEVGYIEGRINNQHPYVCSVKYYQICNGVNHDMREIVLSVEKVVPFSMRDWTQMNVLNAVLGFKRLVMVYGTF